MLLVGLAVFAASALAAGLATSSGVLIAARAVQGLGAAAIAPAALALVMGLFPSGPGRGRALGVWGAVSGAGGAAGVLLGGALTQALGWRWIFFAVAIGTVFVPAASASNEDYGYLLTVISDLKQDASKLLILEASGLDQIAAVHLPRRVTGGIHGSWIPDSALNDTEEN